MDVDEMEIASIANSNNNIFLKANGASPGRSSSSISTASCSSNVETFKTCCLDSFENKDDFMVVESTETLPENISSLPCDDSKFISMCKDVAFKKKTHSNIPNVSNMFENIIDNDNSCDTDANESSIRLSRFQKRKRQLPPDKKDFVGIDFSDNSEVDSTDNSREPSKFRFSKKNKDQSCFDVPDYGLSITSSTDGTENTDEDNTSQVQKNKFFKKPFDSFICVNNSATDVTVTNTPTEKLTRKTTEVIDNAFDNIIHESSMASETSNYTNNWKNTDVSNVNRVSLCSSLEMPSFNRTYDIPPNGNSTQNPLFSQSVHEKESNTTSVGQLINETYTLHNCVVSPSNHDVSTKLKTTLSDTYTIRSNPNATFTKQQSSLRKNNNTINTLVDVSNQSKSSVKQQKFLRKLQLDNVSQDYNFTITDSDNSIVNDDTRNDKYKKFKSKKISHSEGFEMFDNIIFNSQDNEPLTSKGNVVNKSISETLTTAGTSINNDLYNISSKCMENTEELTKRSNVILDGAFEKDQSICSSPVSLKSHSFRRSNLKFDFKKQFGRHSLSYQEKPTNSSFIVKPHNISLSNSVFNKTVGERSSTFLKSLNKDNVNFDSNSEICQTPKRYYRKSQQLNVSSPLMSTTIDKEVEENGFESSQNISLKPSQSLEPCFTGKLNINANSGVFCNIIDDSLNDDISLDVSKQIKFKNHKNKSLAHSVMFENIITNSQDSLYHSINQNKTLGQSVLYDQSNIHVDEISVFANSDEFLSNDDSVDNYQHRSKKIKINDSMSKVEESKCLKDNITTLNDATEEVSLNCSKAKSFNGQCHLASDVMSNGQYAQNNLSDLGESVDNLSASSIAASNLKTDSSSSIHLKISLSKSVLENDNKNTSCLTNKISPDENIQKKNSIILEADSTIQEQNDEISMFANTDELLSNSKSIGNCQIDNGEISNLGGSNSSADELNIFNETTKDNSLKRSRIDFFEGKKTNISTNNNKSRSTTHLKSTNVSAINSNGQFEQNNTLSSGTSVNKCSTKSILQSLTRSMSSTSNNSLTLKDNIKNVSKNSTSTKRKSSANLTVELENTGLSLFNATSESFEQTDLSISKSKTHHSPNNSRDCSITSNKSLTPKDNTNNSTQVSDCSTKNKYQSLTVASSTSLTDQFQGADDLMPLNNTVGSLEHKELSLHQSKSSTSNSHLLNNSKDESITKNKSLTLKVYTKHSSRISNSSTLTDQFRDADDLISLNNTVVPLEHKELSLHQSKPSISKSHSSNNSRDESITKNTSLTLKVNKKNSSRISDGSIKQENQSFNIASSTSLTNQFQEADDLIPLNNTVGPLEHKELSLHQSKPSTSNSHLSNNSRGESITKNKSLTLKVDTKNSSKISDSSTLTDQFQDADDLIPLNNTIGPLDHKELSLHQSKPSTSKSHSSNNSRDESITKNSSWTLKVDTKNSSKISDSSTLTDQFQDADDLIPLNNTIGPLDHKELSLHQSKPSTSKSHSSNNSRDESITKNTSLTLKVDTKNSSKIFDSSTKQKDQSFNIARSTSLTNQFQEADDLIPLNNTVGPLEHKELSLHESKPSTSNSHLSNKSRDESITKNKKLEDNTNKGLRMSSRLAARNNQSVGNVKLKTSSIINSSRSRKKSLLCKTLKNNHIKANDVRSASASSVNSAVKCYTNDGDSKADSSLLWTTTSESSTSTSRTVQNMNSRSNLKSVSEQIDNAIGNMSVSKHTTSHPGAFVLDEYNNGQLLRSSKSSTHNSPSILTRALAKDNNFDSTFTEISLPGVNYGGVVEHLTEKYQSLYNKEVWITKRLYKFLVVKLQERYKIYAVKYAEKFVKYLASILNQAYKDKNADLQLFSDMLRYHMAKYGIINTTSDYLGFLTDYIPRPYYDKLMPRWNLEASFVNFNEQNHYVPIMEDETFLNMILEKLNT